MNRPLLSLTVTALTFGAAAAYAQTTSQTTVVTQPTHAGAGVGVASGAVTGALVGGPVGAVVGAVVGGVAGAMIDPPAEVQTYVRTQDVPQVTYDGEVVVGQPLPAPVAVYDVPNYEGYSWTYVNGKRVLVDRQSRRVVALVPEQTTVVTQKPRAGAGVGVVSGAATGAMVGGPVGAVIGGVVGGVAGALMDPPAEVKTYVRSQTMAPIAYDGRIVVGEPLPAPVAVYRVPDNERYSWTYVNGQRILVDHQTRKVVAVIE